jgi:hypothetical protein
MARIPECVGFIGSLCVYGFLRESICRFWCGRRREGRVRCEKRGRRFGYIEKDRERW